MASCCWLILLFKRIPVYYNIYITTACKRCHLWGDVVWGPAEGGGPYVILHVLLTHTKVCYLYMTIWVQQHVVQFQISAEVQENDSSWTIYYMSWISVLFLALTECLPVNNSFRVQKLEPTDDLSCIEAVRRHRCMWEERIKFTGVIRFRPN